MSRSSAMPQAPTNPGDRNRRDRKPQAISKQPPRYNRLLSLAIQDDNYKPGRTSRGALYVLHAGRRYGYYRRDRSDLRAELRATWCQAYTDEGIGDEVIRAVAAELERRSKTVAADEPTAAEKTDDLIRTMSAEQTGGASQPYYIENGCTWWNRPAQGGGSSPFILATFTAEIAEEVTLDDGTPDRILTWLLRLKAQDGREGDVRIPPDQLGRPQQWAPRAVGTSALVMPGQTVQDHLRVAIHTASKSVVRRTVYKHTGWREIRGVHVYLSASGALGAEGLDESVTVELEDALSGYRIPDVPAVTALREAIRISTGLIELAADDKMVATQAATYRAPLPLLPDCAVWQYGPSGAFKSETTALGQQHYGPGMNVDALPGHWTSTGNRLEMEAHVLAGALFVVDDFHPPTSAADARIQDAKAEKLLRGSANHSATGRLRPDATMRPAKPPRAQVLTSAEDLPPSTPSLRARAMIEELPLGAVNVKLLTAAQRDAADGVLATAMAGYIRSIAERWDAERNLPARLAAARAKFRDEFRRNGHPRFATNIASLLLGWHEWLAYATSIGAISQEERDGYWVRVRKAIQRLGADQERYQRDGDPVSVYLRSLIALIASGRAYLARPDGGAPPDPDQWGWLAIEPANPDDPRMSWRPQGQRLGWIDGDDVYLQPDAAYTAARQYADASGTPLSKTKTVLHKALRERGLLKGSVKDRLTVQRNVGGERNKHVLNLAADTFGTKDGHE